MVLSGSRAAGWRKERTDHYGWKMMENDTVSVRPANSEFVCHICHQQFWARIGLTGHR